MTHPNGFLTEIEAAKLLYDSWKFRVTHAWSSITRYYFAASFIAAIPHLLPLDRVGYFGEWLYVFPFVGGAAALGAIWLYGAEYVRAQTPNDAYRDILKRHGHYAPYVQAASGKPTRWNQLFMGPAVGRVTVVGLGIATLALCVVNFVLVFRLVSKLA